MAGHDLTEHVIEPYLAAVATGLVGPRAARTAILDELRDGLQEAATLRRARGAAPEAAVVEVLREFGPPAALATSFAGELATCRARRTALTYLLTGPLVGLAWLLMLAPTSWLRRGPTALWAAIPATPVIGIAAVAGLLVLAATGRPSRWLELPSGHVLHGAFIVIAAAALGDLIMLILATQSAASRASPTLAVLAVTASVVRLGCGLAAGAHCLRSFRSLLGR